MADYFEVDFLTVGESQSSDAITVRYELSGRTYVHVVDGGFQNDGAHVPKADPTALPSVEC